MGGYVSTVDGGIEVDSNVGTVDELKAELATETPKPHGTGKAAPIVDVRLVEKPVEDVASDEDEKPAVDAKPAQTAKKKNSLQARIDEITAERHTTARERDEAREETRKLQAELAALKSGKPSETAKTGIFDGVPFTEDAFPKFAKYLEMHPEAELEDWIRADRKWEAAKAQFETESARTQDTARAEHSERFTAKAKTYYERMKPTLDADPTFYDKIDPRLVNTPPTSALKPGQTPTLGNFLVEQVIRSEHPKALLEHLSDPTVVQRLVTLPPDEIIRAITTFEAQQRPAGATTGPSADEHDDDDESDEDTPSKVAATTRSEAHSPVKPVRGSSQQSTGDDEPGDDDSDDAWYRAERKRLAKQRAARVTA